MGKASWDFDEIREIAECMSAANIQSFEISERRGSLRLAFRDGLNSGDPPAGHGAIVNARSSGSVMIAAGSVGVFLDTHPMRSAPFVRVSGSVRAGTIVALLKIGVIYAPVTAPYDGSIITVLASHGSVVELGAPLFALRPAAIESSST